MGREEGGGERATGTSLGGQKAVVHQSFDARGIGEDTRKDERRMGSAVTIHPDEVYYSSEQYLGPREG